MALNDIITEIPSLILAGTTVKIKRTYSEFPASAGWSLKLALQGKSSLVKTSAPHETDNHLFTFLPSETDTELAAGTYRWREYATTGATEIWPTASGMLEVEPDFISATGGSLQLWYEKAIEALEARITGRLADGADMQAFQIGSRMVQNIPIEECVGLLNLFRASLNGMLNTRFGRPVYIRFPGVNG